MKATEALRDIKTKKGLGLTEMAYMLGWKTDSSGIAIRRVNDRLHQENISISRMDELLRVMGYKIILMPVTTKEAPDWYKVE
ncbi:MAG: hypothetical protein J6N19_02960 [Clostridium sp.]|nr:hypothetical protein [Clostridium sp.]